MMNIRKSDDVIIQKTISYQSGSVLVIAMFIVALITVLATRFTSNFQLLVARSQNDLVANQLQQLLFSVEDFAGWVILQDADNDQNNGRYQGNGVKGSYDHLQEDWTETLQVPVNDATIKASLSDALSRFNINQLQGRPSPYKPNGSFSEKYTTAQQRFIRLLQTHPDDIVDVSLAQEITEAVVDWIDSDNSPTGIGGAEDSYYNSLEKPHRAANRLFASIEELRQVKGVSKEIYRYLEPLLVALPNAEGININTAPIALIRTLNQKGVETPLSEEDAQRLIGSRASEKAFLSDGSLAPATGQAYESVEEFLSSTDANQIFDTDPELWPPAQGLRTGTEYFLLEAEAELLDYKRHQKSIVRRYTAATGFKTVIIHRTQLL